MKVYLIKTPEYQTENLIEVCDFLNSFDGTLEFIPSTYEFSEGEFNFLGNTYLKNFEGVKKVLYDNTMETPLSWEQQLSWEQLFSLCNHYRNLFKVEKNDFIVLLTLRNNVTNWFSHNDSTRNVFIQTANWENYIQVHHKYPVAYEVLENIMQSLMHVTSEVFPSQYIHQKPRGCMNDFCEDKEQIILKLQTANICVVCAEKIQEENIDQKIVNQTLEIFEGIRKELLFKQKFRKQVEPVSITINESRQIILPQLDNLEIRLNPLFKTLYIFYLKHTGGVKLNELNDFREELLALYKKLSGADNNNTIEVRIADLVNPIGGSFSQKKSKLNKIITDLLGEPLAKFYRIEGEPGEPFKINIPNNLIDIRY